MGGAPTLPPVGLTCTGPQEGAPEATCQIQAATSTPSVHRSAPRSPRQDHHRAPHDANSRLQTGGITTIGPRHADDTPPRASYGRNSPHRYITTKVARNFLRSFFETARKHCNSNVLNSMFEILAGELRATLLGNHSGISHRRGHRREGHRRAWLRCPWAVAGPGRASRRRAERSSRRGRLAGGPPSTGTTSSPARQHTTRHPEHQWHHKQPRNANARQPVRAAARSRN